MRRKLFINFLIIIVYNIQDSIGNQNLHGDVDSAFLELYFQNSRLVDFQSKCLFEDSPCDIVGRWLKPRLAAGLQGFACHQCSISQSDTLLTIINRLKKQRPDFYEKALITFLNNRQLLDLLTKEYVVRGQSRSNKTQQPIATTPLPVSPSVPAVSPDVEEILLVESSIERRHTMAPNVDENFIPGKPSRTFVDTSLLDIFIIPRSSHSFSIPILTKSDL